MNLHAIVAGAIAVVNPMIAATLRVSTGYTTAPNGSQVPAYADSVPITVQMQPLPTDDLKLVEGMGIQGIRQKFYAFGNIKGMVRKDGTGGDMIQLADGTVWKTVIVTEDWPDWCSVIATQQIDWPDWLFPIAVSEV